MSAVDRLDRAFTGWSSYGYWLNGELMNGKPGSSRWQGEVIQIKSTAEERKARREAWKKSVEQAALTKAEVSQALDSYIGNRIPTLDTWQR